MILFLQSIYFSALVFFFTDTATTEIYTLSLHDALPICFAGKANHHIGANCSVGHGGTNLLNLLAIMRSEEHTSELQSRFDLVCRLLLEKKKKKSDNVFYNLFI